MKLKFLFALLFAISLSINAFAHEYWFEPETSHCGGVSQWSVASGGRMGQMMGEDAVEIAPAARFR